MICRRDIMSLYSNINYYNRVCKALHITIGGAVNEREQEKRIILLVYNIVEVIIVLSLSLYRYLNEQENH